MSDAHDDLVRIARLVVVMSKLDVSDPMDLVLLNVQLGTVAALSKMALERECATRDGMREALEHIAAIPSIEFNTVGDTITDATNAVMAAAGWIERARAIAQNAIKGDEND